MPVHIESITLQNTFSFGPEAQTLELRPLNVVIGPNGSGKSNLVDAFTLLASTPMDLQAGIRAVGGAETLVYCGRSCPGADLSVVLPPSLARPRVTHEIGLSAPSDGGNALVMAERVGGEGGGTDGRGVTLYNWAGDGPWLSEHREDASFPPTHWAASEAIQTAGLSPFQSILAQRRDPQRYPALAELCRAYGGIRVYADWESGRRSTLRRGSDTGFAGQWLLEEAQNLGLLVANMQTWSTWRRIDEAMGEFLDRYEGIGARIDGNRATVFLREQGLSRPIPATRLSEGTVRFIALLSVLLNDDPPPFVILEEPETNLHPDAIVLVADLLREASQRMQILVTTHSDILVERLSDVPEDVAIASHEDGSTRLRRVDRDVMEQYVRGKYHLGGVWMRGGLRGACPW